MFFTLLTLKTDLGVNQIEAVKIPGNTECYCVPCIALPSRIHVKIKSQSHRNTLFQKSLGDTAGYQPSGFLL